MKWKKIDPSNYPKKEVLAACFDEIAPNGYYKRKLVGKLIRFVDIMYCCTSNNQLPFCTHYIDINSFDEDRE